AEEGNSRGVAIHASVPHRAHAGVAVVNVHAAVAALPALVAGAAVVVQQVPADPVHTGLRRAFVDVFVASNACSMFCTAGRPVVEAVPASARLVPDAAIKGGHSQEVRRTVRQAVTVSAGAGLEPANTFSQTSIDSARHFNFNENIITATGHQSGQLKVAHRIRSPPSSAQFAGLHPAELGLAEQHRAVNLRLVSLSMATMIASLSCGAAKAAAVAVDAVRAKTRTRDLLTRRSSSKNSVSMSTLPLSALADIIWLSGAASIIDCQVFVEPGITKPNSKFHSGVRRAIGLRSRHQSGSGVALAKVVIGHSAGLPLLLHRQLTAANRPHRLAPFRQTSTCGPDRGAGLCKKFSTALYIALALCGTEASWGPPAAPALTSARVQGNGQRLGSGALQHQRAALVCAALQPQGEPGLAQRSHGFRRLRIEAAVRIATGLQVDNVAGPRSLGHNGVVGGVKAVKPDGVDVGGRVGEADPAVVAGHDVGVSVSLASGWRRASRSLRVVDEGVFPRIRQAVGSGFAQMRGAFEHADALLVHGLLQQVVQGDENRRSGQGSGAVDQQRTVFDARCHLEHRQVLHATVASNIGGIAGRVAAPIRTVALRRRESVTLFVADQQSAVRGSQPLPPSGWLTPPLSSSMAWLMHSPELGRSTLVMRKYRPIAIAASSRMNRITRPTMSPMLAPPPPAAVVVGLDVLAAGSAAESAGQAGWRELGHDTVAGQVYAGWRHGAAATAGRAAAQLNSNYTGVTHSRYLHDGTRSVMDRDLAATVSLTLSVTPTLGEPGARVSSMLIWNWTRLVESDGGDQLRIMATGERLELLSEATCCDEARVVNVSEVEATPTLPLVLRGGRGEVIQLQGQAASDASEGHGAGHLHQVVGNRRFRSRRRRPAVGRPLAISSLLEPEIWYTKYWYSRIAPSRRLQAGGDQVKFSQSMPLPSRLMVTGVAGLASTVVYVLVTAGQPIRLHCFPSNDKVAQHWQQILELEFIELATIRKEKLRVCSLHFLSSAYNCPALRHSAGARLRWDALPDLELTMPRLSRYDLKPVVARSDEEADNTYPPQLERWDKDLVAVAMPHLSLSPPSTQSRNQCVAESAITAGHSKTLVQLRKTRQCVSRQRATIKRLQQQICKAKAIKFGSTTMRRMASNSRKLHFIAARGMRWSKDDLTAAIRLHHKSPAAYRMLRKDWQLPLPSESALKRRTCQFFKSPGVCSTTLMLLKQKLATGPEHQRIATLCFDGMSLSPSVRYDQHKDEVIGFDTSSSTENAQRVLKPITEAIVAVLRGVSANWKQAIAYYPNLRNALMKNDVAFDGHKLAKWQHVVDFFEADRSRSLRLASQLTDAHIALPLGQKMRVSIAAQVLSHSVASGMQTLVHHQEIEPSALQTAEFLQRVNDLFDMLNSAIVHDKGFKRPIFRESLAAQTNELRKAEAFLQSLRFLPKSGKPEKSTMKFKEAWRLSAASIRELSTALIDEESFDFVCTRSLTQDHVEVAAQIVSKLLADEIQFPACSAHFSDVHNSIVLAFVRLRLHHWCREKMCSLKAAAYKRSALTYANRLHGTGRGRGRAEEISKKRVGKLGNHAKPIRIVGIERSVGHGLVIGIWQYLQEVANSVPQQAARPIVHLQPIELYRIGANIYAGIESPAQSLLMTLGASCMAGSWVWQPGPIQAGSQPRSQLPLTASQPTLPLQWHTKLQLKPNRLTKAPTPQGVWQSGGMAKPLVQMPSEQPPLAFLRLKQLAAKVKRQHNDSSTIFLRFYNSRDALVTQQSRLSVTFDAFKSLKSHKSYPRVSRFTTNSQRPVSVRLVGGSKPNLGVVEVTMSTGAVGRICNLGFDNNGASVVCAMLGYRGVTGLKVDLPPYTVGNTNTVMAISGCPDFLEASTSTWNLETACRYVVSSFPPDCAGNGRDAAVICTGTQTTSTPGPTLPPDFATIAPIDCNNTITSLRLDPGPEEGLVLIQNGSLGGDNFGTICAAGFSAIEAATICRMLCRNETANAIGMSGKYLTTAASYPVMLSGLKCPAGATSTNDCKHNGWGAAPSYCTPNTAVSVRCSQISLTPPPIPAPFVVCHLYVANVFFTYTDVASASLLSLYGTYNETTCNFTKNENSTTVWATVPYIGCNSVQTTNATHVIYTSMLYRNVTAVSGVYVDVPYIIPVECAIPKLKEVTAALLPDARTAPPITGGDSYTSEVKLYRSYNARGFSSEIAPGDRLVVGSRIYARVRETSPLNVRLTVRNCWASDKSDGTGASYYVVRNKCATDANSVFRVDEKNIGINFAVMSFTQTVSTQAYIFCDVTICTPTDPDERCLQTCGTAVRRRRKRQLSTENEKESSQQPSRGPYILTAMTAMDVEASRAASIADATLLWLMTTALVAAVAWNTFSSVFIH
uniref:Protein kinase domain-containing protein n=2 Tax=Macrostomum lignano TaxID=282301 RepID=A0A1I8GSG7_9PLAT